MAVLPEHQGQGLGSAVLQRLLDTIRADAPGRLRESHGGRPGQALYRHGFQDRAPHTIGMSLRLEVPWLAPSRDQTNGRTGPSWMLPAAPSSGGGRAQ
ncbi:GNAT family N-acetyltransferase [Kocuria rhizophila]|nr:GNAT family N-acetyltransferase [Kocuria rhizophila]